MIVGSYEVSFFGGFGTAISYKGLELSTFFSFVKGNEIYNNDRMNVENPTYFYDNMWRDLQYEWRTPGQKTHIIAATADFDGWTGTDHFVEKGDFLRFRNAMLSYSLPTSIISKAKIKSVRMFVQGQNIFVWHDFLGFDPEISTGSLTGAQYPPMRTFTFGLNIGL